MHIITAGLKELSQAMTPVHKGTANSTNTATNTATATSTASYGPFFLGTELTLVDIVLLPWFQRLQSVTKHYRQFEVPSGKNYITFIHIFIHMVFIPHHMSCT